MERTVGVQNERHRVLVEMNDTAVEYPRDKCVHELFEEQVARTPDATALVYRDQRLSYRELNRRANQLAHHLRKAGVGPDVLVGISMHRCVEMIVAILGTIKAGGAYVPLDPSYPKTRLSGMFEDVEMKVLLTKRDLLDSLPESAARTICLDRDWDVIGAESGENPLSQASPENLVYVIFTSGSTGKPKAAAVHHRGWTNLMTWFVAEFNVRQPDRVLLISSFSFDITQRSIAMPLIAGGELHLHASNYYEPSVVRQTIADQRITLLNCAPSMFYLLVENGTAATFQKLRSLRTLFLGGEAISASRLRDWVESPDCFTAVVNVYGVAECSDVSSFYRLNDFKRYAETSVPVGKPIQNSQVYILDEDLEPMPFGEAGEICLAGDGIGRGYINDPDLTAAKFVRNPFSKDPLARLYRSGDVGRFLPDGTIEYVGRVDHQVKIQGMRIDLGDVETTLRQHPAVREAVVMSKDYGPGDQRLVAFLVPRQQASSNEVKPRRLRTFLKDRLPKYMVPADYFVLTEMPLSPNGKIDRKALINRAGDVVSHAS